MELAAVQVEMLTRSEYQYVTKVQLVQGCFSWIRDPDLYRWFMLQPAHRGKTKDKAEKRGGSAFAIATNIPALV